METTILTLMAVILILIGCFATLLSKRAFDKLIMLGLLVAGVIMLFVKNGFLDVAIAVGLLMPIGTLFILFLLGKKKSVLDTTSTDSHSTECQSIDEMNHGGEE